MTTPTTPEEQPVETLGNRFRRARTSLGKTLQEAAAVTCINPKILDAMESDDFTKVSAEVFTRGFIKLYAQYLGMDADEAIKLYIKQASPDQAQTPEQPYNQDTITAMARPPGLFKSNPRLRIIAILLVALLSLYVLGAILKAVQKHPDQTAPENELGKSLMESDTPPLPGQPGEPPAAPEDMGEGGIPATDSAGPPEATQPGTGNATNAQAVPETGETPAASSQPFQSSAPPMGTAGQKTHPAPEGNTTPPTAARPEEMGRDRPVGGTVAR